MSDQATRQDQLRERRLEALAANIVHQIGDVLYEALPLDVAHKYFVNARQATNDRAIDFAKKVISGNVGNPPSGLDSADTVITWTTTEPEPQVMAHRLVASALMMKRQYQNAGLVIAREFCAAYGIDVQEIERKLRESGKPFGRVDTSNPRMGQIDATENGNAWFWAGRRQDHRQRG